jgi:cellulose synthase operon protein C
VAEQAVAKSPGNAYAIDTLGWMLYQNGEQIRSLQLLRDARLRVPGSSVIRYHLGVALVKAGRSQEAREELEAALKGAVVFEGASEAAALLRTLK